MTEYRFHDRDDFVVIVDYFTRDDLRRQFRELLQAYRENESPGPDATQEDLARLRETAKVAKATFTASFRERLEQTPAVLSLLPLDDAIQIMIEWSSQMLPRQASVEESFDTVDRCSSRLSELTSESHQPRPNRSAETCLWPFVKKLRCVFGPCILCNFSVSRSLHETTFHSNSACA